MKKIICVLLAVAMSFVFTACTSGSEQTVTPSSAPEEVSTPEVSDTSQAPAATEETPEESFEPVTLRVAYMPNMGSASLQVTARDFGFFDKYGITVELVEFGDGPSEIAAMASGDIDISQIGHGAHALCIEGQAVVFYPEAIGLSSAVIGNKSSGISTLEDLKGKKVAYVAGTGSEELLKLALSKVGLTMDDIEAINVDVAGMVTSMASGQVDAAASSQPYTTTIKNALGDNFIQLCEDRDYLEERTLMNSCITTTQFAEKNYDVLVRYARALLDAADYRSANIEEVAKAVAKQCQGDEATFLGLTEECIWLSGNDVNTYLKDGTLVKYYENAQAAFLSGGRITESVPVEDYIRFDIIQAACDANYGE
jgi:NitT/TauT family transport system substrate-binding protein